MTAQELKDRMLEQIEWLKAGVVPTEGLSDKDLFIIEHFVRSFPTSNREGGETPDDTTDDRDPVFLDSDGAADHRR